MNKTKLLFSWNYHSNWERHKVDTFSDRALKKIEQGYVKMYRVGEVLASYKVVSESLIRGCLPKDRMK